MAISAIILDFDGTVLDTETPTFEVWREVYRQHGVDLELDLWQHIIGTHGGFDPCAHLVNMAGSTLVREELQDVVSRSIYERCAQEPLRPGVMDLLQKARDLGLKTAIASSSSADWVEGWLIRHRIRDRFDCVLCRDHVQRVKPAPDLYRLAAQELEVRPETCLAVEDSPNGAKAACAAGMLCVVVPNGLTRKLEFPPVDLTMQTLAEMSPEEMLQHISIRLSAGRRPIPRRSSGRSVPLRDSESAGSSPW